MPSPKADAPPPQLWRFFDPAISAAELTDIRVADHSHGSIAEPETFYPAKVFPGRPRTPVRNGIYCCKIFGPIEDDQCLCGHLSGSASRGQTCQRCGVLCGLKEERDRRWGHVEVPGVLHPAGMKAMAGALGLSVKQIRAVLQKHASIVVSAGTTRIVELAPDGDDEKENVDEQLNALEAEAWPSGANEILRALRLVGASGEAWLIRQIPVPPPGLRPQQPPPKKSGRWRPGPINLALQKLVRRANQWRRLIELDAPPAIQVNEGGRTQAAFESYIRKVAANLPKA